MFQNSLAFCYYKMLQGHFLPEPQNQLIFDMSYFHFHLSQNIFNFHLDFLLTHNLFRSMFFTFQILDDFINSVPLLISTLILVWSKNILCRISILNFMRFVLWPRMCPILVNFPCALRKIVYSAVVVYLEHSINVNQVKLVNGVVQIIYIFTDIYQAKCQSIYSKQNCGFVYLSFQDCPFFPLMYFESLLLGT